MARARREATREPSTNVFVDLSTQDSNIEEVKCKFDLYSIPQPVKLG
jgi:hypothetical protein